MQGDKWRETIEEAVILGSSMQENKGRETNEEGRFWESARRETDEEGRLGAAAISVISMQGNK